MWYNRMGDIMEKLKNKKVLIIIGVIVVIIIIAVLLIMFLPKATNEVSAGPKVKHNVVNELYQEVETNKTEGTREYVSKLYGYSYDENENIVMQVKEGYIENNKVYDLDGNELGEYTEDTLNTTLDNGTLKTYNYTKENNDYKLEK